MRLKNGVLIVDCRLLVYERMTYDASRVGCIVSWKEISWSLNTLKNIPSTLIQQVLDPFDVRATWRC